jgi:hypothetical protein
MKQALSGHRRSVFEQSGWRTICESRTPFLIRFVAHAEVQVTPANDLRVCDPGTREFGPVQCGALNIKVFR